MNYYTSRLEETGKPVHGSWTFLVFIVFGLTAIMSLIMIIMPVTLLFVSHDSDSFFWLILIPIGVWILNKALVLFKTFINKRNQHQSQFMIDSNGLAYTVVNNASEQTDSGVIPLPAIKHAVASIYRLKNNHLYTNAFTDTSVLVDDFPILFIIFEDGATLKQIEIPFYDEFSIKEWLLYLQQHNIPLFYGYLNPHMRISSNNAILEELLDTDVMIPFQIKKSSDWRWVAIELRLEAYSLLSQTIAQKDNIEELTQPEDQVHARRLNQVQEQTFSPPKLTKLTFNKWSRAAVKTYLIICVGALIAIYLAEKGAMDYKGPLPGFALLFISALVYFWSLRRHFRWFYMISFCLESFIVILLSAVFINEENTTPVIDEMISSLLASAIFFPLIIWIPYSIMAYIRKRIIT